MSFPVNPQVTTDLLKVWGQKTSFDLQRQRLEDAALLTQIKEEITRLQRIQHFIESKYMYSSLFFPMNEGEACTSPTSGANGVLNGDSLDSNARKLPSVVNLLNTSNAAPAAVAPSAQSQPLTVLYELLQQQQLQEQQQQLQLNQANLPTELSFQKNPSSPTESSLERRSVPIFAIPEPQNLLSSHTSHIAPKKQEINVGRPKFDTTSFITNPSPKKPSDMVRYHKQGRGKLPEKATEILSRWLFEHANAPYPTPYEKEKLMEDTRLSLIQINNWFVNARRRLLPGLVKNDPEKILSRTVYVGNVDEKITPLELIGFFNACCGPILKSKVVEDQMEKIFIFEFGCSQSASKAVRLSGTFLGNFPIKVSIADGKYELLSRPEELQKDDTPGSEAASPEEPGSSSRNGSAEDSHNSGEAETSDNGSEASPEKPSKKPKTE
eukprot:TRINITY_DN1049_c0_g1_i2.p1 TRINITY_DN1049_c0_g1~~TRINITY_DN1049_c0_g1_i2.p1  ORF type:complete len:438 (+),score=91.01 TRINITY_DN1049_c0_g1_i2:166-1479(+)